MGSENALLHAVLKTIGGLPLGFDADESQGVAAWHQPAVPIGRLLRRDTFPTCGNPGSGIA